MSLEKLFHLKENHTDVKTEVLAGITTFMTMAYILAVNPGILGATVWTAVQSLQPPQCQLCLLLYVWHLWQTTHLYLHQVWA